jgi:hypothetical protein
MVQLLRLSELERDGPLKEIILSTTGVVFFASPHRATEHCALLDAIKSMAGATSQMDPQDPVLQQLSGADSLLAELGRQTFVRLWNDFNFRVKTFQESIIPTYRFRELRVEAVSVPLLCICVQADILDHPSSGQLHWRPPRKCRDHWCAPRRPVQVCLARRPWLPRAGQHSV